MTAPLLAAAAALPLLLAAAALFERLRPAVARLLPAAPLPALAALALPDGAALSLPYLLLGIELGLDPLRRAFLGFTALLWALAGLYARGYLGDQPLRDRFFALYLVTMAGNLGLLLARDAVGFYLFFSIMTLSSYVLVVHEQTARAYRAGRVYILLALLGEVALLLGFMTAAASAGTTEIARLPAAVAAAPDGALVLALLLAGFGIKAGLVPLHVWLPLAHAAAPTPASAVLSGAIVKAGILGCILFLPAGGAAPGWAAGLAWAGIATAFYGVAAGLPQANPKTILAYSTVSQMGLLMCGVGAALAIPEARAGQAALALYALHHGLVKGALFLGVGVVLAVAAGRRGPLLALQAALCLAMAGLPLTSGALAKATIGAVIEESPLIGPLYHLLSLAAVGTTLLMLRFLAALQAQPAPRQPQGAALPALLVPWLLLLLASQGGSWLLWLQAETVSAAAAPGALWSAAWPLLLGIALALAGRAGGAAARIRALPVPEGDLLGLAPRLSRIAAALERLAASAFPADRWRLRPGPGISALDRALANGERALQRAAVGGTALLLLGALLAALLLLGHRG